MAQPHEVEHGVSLNQDRMSEDRELTPTWELLSDEVPGPGCARHVQAARVAQPPSESRPLNSGFSRSTAVWQTLHFEVRDVPAVPSDDRGHVPRLRLRSEGLNGRLVHWVGRAHVASSGVGEGLDVPGDLTARVDVRPRERIDRLRRVAGGARACCGPHSRVPGLTPRCAEVSSHLNDLSAPQSPLSSELDALSSVMSRSTDQLNDLHSALCRLTTVMWSSAHAHAVI